MTTPHLYIVATPLGNLEDLSFRAVRILKEVDVVAAEDTRRCAKLLNHVGVTKPMISYWGAKEKVKSAEVIKALEDGKTIALVSDAGTPGISDPGRVVVAEAVRRGFPVVPVAGPSALTAALSISGMVADRFVFAGFLPPKRGPRRRTLEQLRSEPHTLVFFEAPHRIFESLADMKDVLGADRGICLARELTKCHEETLRGTIGEVLDLLEQSVVAGEYVVIVEGQKAPVEGDLEAALRDMVVLMRRGQSRKAASALVAGQYGISRKRIYDASLDGIAHDRPDERP